MSRKQNPVKAAEKAQRQFYHKLYLAERAFMRDCFERDDSPYPSDVLYSWSYELVDKNAQPLPPDPAYYLRPDYMRPEVAGVRLEGCLTWRDAEAGNIRRASYLFDELLT